MDFSILNFFYKTNMVGEPIAIPIEEDYISLSRCIGAVSYTHLDVYKRKGITHAAAYIQILFVF